MKKIFTHLKGGLLLAIMLIVCAANVRAEEIKLTTSSAGSTWEGGKDGYSTTLEGFKMSYLKNKSTNDCLAPSSDHIRVYKDAKFIIENNNGQSITKLLINTNTSYTAAMTPNSGEVTFDKTAKTITWTGNASSIELTASAQVRFMSIEVTFEGEAAAVSTPSFSVRTGTYYETQTVEIECATAGADIYYTMDGTEPTVDSYPYDAAIEIEETTTLKAIAIKGSDVSKIAEATYTIKEYTKVANIAEFIATNTTEASGTEPVEITNPVTVLFQNGIYLFVKDNSGFLQIYGSINETYNNGDIIPAGIRGTVGYYGKRYQMVPAKDSFKAGEAGDAIEPTVIAINEISAANHCELVKVKKVNVSDVKDKNFNLTCGSENLAGYNRFTDVTIPTTDDEYSVTGILNEYNGNMQLFPIDFTVTTSLDAAFVNSSVIAANGAIRVNAEENGSAVIVNALGQIVANSAIKEGENTFNVTKGLYIVKANGKTTKVLVK